MRNEIIKNNIVLILSLIALSVIIILMVNPDITVNAFYPDNNDNPFDYIRETEEPVYINGTIEHVEYVSKGSMDDYCLMVMSDGRKHWWSDDSFGKIKIHEDETVEILCYTQGWDGYLRLYPCNSDWEMGYIITMLS